MFYDSLLAGVFLSDCLLHSFVAFYIYVFWVCMRIGDMLTTARREMEQVVGNLV